MITHTSGHAAGAWRITAKLQSDCDQSMQQNKEKLHELIHVWILMRTEYKESVPSKISIDISETQSEGTDTRTFVITGKSAFSEVATRAMIRQLSTIFAEIFGLHSVEYIVAGQRAQIYRSRSV